MHVYRWLCAMLCTLHSSCCTSDPQAHAKLTEMNDVSKGGSEYINLKFSNARDALVAEPTPPAGGDADAGAKPTEDKK